MTAGDEVVHAPDSVARPQRILMIGPYAPYRDGIATYTVQQVRALRRDGHHVEVLSPRPSAAHHHLDLTRPRAAKSLVLLSRGFDRVVMQFHPDYYFPQPATFQVRLSRAAALAAALRAGPPATLVLHEIDERWATARDAAGRAVRFLAASFDEVVVHDELQASQMRRAFGVEPSRITVADHGENFVARVDGDQASARRELGIDPGAHVSLCIGFVAEHKGFDRAVTAFGRATSGRGREAASRRAELHVVGAPSSGSDAAARYAAELESLVAVTPGTHLHLGYVSDSVFDRWLLAADQVILPYRHIWSSGVAERAALYDRPVLATRVGGLSEQLAHQPGARVVDDDDHDLAEAIVDILTDAGVIAADHGEVVGAEWQVPAERGEVLAEVRRRAEAQRGFAFVAGPTPTGAAPVAPGDDVRPSRSAAHPGLTPRAAAGGAGAGAGRAFVGLRRIGPLARPAPVSGRPGVTAFKRMQRRLLNWELEPIIGWVDELRRATQEAVEAAAALAAQQEATGGPPPAQVAEVSATEPPGASGAQASTA